ncbi:kelch domain-containing protein 1-like [Mixophyes fleayi]|uniref:kelch domain-containing protein 1-like n=1 Tax=Mixophyes fleayi TaxID=3061075 RepID=UPI003F4E2EC4
MENYYTDLAETLARSLDDDLKQIATCHLQSMDGLPELYVLCNAREPPVRLQRLSSGSWETPSFSAPLSSPISSQLLFFSFGDWSGLSPDSRVDVQLEAEGDIGVRLGTLSPESRCFIWECGPGYETSCMSENGEVSVSMVIQGQVCVKPTGSNQECKKRKRLKESESEDIFQSVVVKRTCKAHQYLSLPDHETVILIGGQGTQKQFCKDSMWKLYTESNTWFPVEAVTDGSNPEARTGHTAVFDPESQRIYVFGGFKNRKWFNEVHVLDTLAWRWWSVEAMGKVPPLSYHTCTLFMGELFVFGGVFPRPNPEPDGCSDTLHIFNPQHEIWYQPIVLGNKLSARSGHSACLLNRKLYIFGGWDTPACYNDLYLLDVSLMQFAPVEVNGSSPTPRCWHSAANLSDSSFLIFGGYDGIQAPSDTHIFNTVTKTWTSLVHNSLPHFPSAGFSMLPIPGVKEGSEDCVPRELLIFGGGNNEGQFYCDTVRLQISDILDQ